MAGSPVAATQVQAPANLVAGRDQRRRPAERVSPGRYYRKSRCAVSDLTPCVDRPTCEETGKAVCHPGRHGHPATRAWQPAPWTARVRRGQCNTTRLKAQSRSSQMGVIKRGFTGSIGAGDRDNDWPFIVMGEYHRSFDRLKVSTDEATDGPGSVLVNPNHQFRGVRHSFVVRKRLRLEIVSDPPAPLFRIDGSETFGQRPAGPGTLQCQRTASVQHRLNGSP